MSKSFVATPDLGTQVRVVTGAHKGQTGTVVGHLWSEGRGSYASVYVQIDGTDERIVANFLTELEAI